MRINNGLSPYPILSESDDDYVKGYFDAFLSQSEKRIGNKLEFNVEYQLKDDDLQALINHREAVFAVHFECPLTCYRMKCESQGNTCSFLVNMDDLAHEAEVSTYIIAAKQIKGFHDRNINTAYTGMSFDFEKGNILAIGPSFTLPINREGKEGRDLPTLFEFIGDKESGGYTVNLYGPTIQIHVSPDWKTYYSNHRNRKYEMNCMLVMSATIMALTEICRNRDCLRERRWYKIFEETLKANHIDIDELSLKPQDKGYVNEVAQTILKHPIDTALIEMKEIDDQHLRWRNDDFAGVDKRRS